LKRKDRKIRGFYFITDSHLSRAGNFSDVKSALQAGVQVIQYRHKFYGTKEMYAQALKLRRLCQEAIFLVDDRVDIAQAVDADGIHLGQEDIPCAVARKVLGKDKIIGVTVHSLKEARAAQKSGADYLAVGPIFRTLTKKNPRSPVGTGLIKKIKKEISLPVVAIGGINLANAAAVIDARADGLCAISAVVTRPNVKKEVEKFQRLFKEKRGRRCS